MTSASGKLFMSVENVNELWCRNDAKFRVENFCYSVAIIVGAMPEVLGDKSGFIENNNTPFSANVTKFRFFAGPCHWLLPVGNTLSYGVFL